MIDAAPVAAALPGTTAAACTACLHLTRRGTCLEPVAAGLLTEAEGFGIVWPPEGYGAACPGYSGKVPGDARERSCRLTKVGADAAHAEPWNEPAIARFQARAHRLQRLGFDGQDAEDLAERLHLRDAEADERRMCAECDHYRPGRCGNHRRAGLQAPDIGHSLVALLQWCPGFENSR